MADSKKEKKKKKGGAGILLILLLMLLLFGAGLGFGLGGFGGLIPGSSGNENAGQQPAETTAETEKPTETQQAPETGAAAAKSGPYVITVSENGILLDGREMTLEQLTAEVTHLPAGAELVLKDDHALMADYGDVKAMLEAAGLTFSEGK